MTPDPVQIRSRKVGLAWTIARFMDDYDHYAFMDDLRNGETIDEGIARVADETLGYLESGDFGFIEEMLESFDDGGLLPEQDETRRSILRELKEIRKLDGKSISKNASRTKRRR